MVPHVILVDEPAIRALEDPPGEGLAPRHRPRPEAKLERDRREAVHRRVDRIPHDCVNEHGGQQDGERRARAPPHEHIGGEDARHHLYCHNHRGRPVEGCAAERVRIEGFRHHVRPPARVVLERHIVVRLSMMLDVAVTRQLVVLGRLASEPREKILQFQEIPWTVELKVLEVAMRHVLIQRHERVHGWNQEDVPSHSRRQGELLRANGCNQVKIGWRRTKRWAAFWKCVKGDEGFQGAHHRRNWGTDAVRGDRMPCMCVMRCASDRRRERRRSAHHDGEQHRDFSRNGDATTVTPDTVARWLRFTSQASLKSAAVRCLGNPPL
eukprot:7385862-Prymnesium_polylepis.2